MKKFYLVVIATAMSGCSTAKDAGHLQTQFLAKSQPVPQQSPAVIQTSEDSLILVSNQTFQNFGLLVKIGRITVNPKMIQVEMTAQNTSNTPLSFDPTSGNVTINTQQVEASIFETTGNLIGNIQPGVTKRGTLCYPIENRVIEIKHMQSIKLALGTVINEKSSEAGDMTIEILIQPQN